ncbi:MAG: DUF1835 domain-containing protein [Bacteroidia bacterium]|nr:DUF1835 domain-containing protein [Bacteroidia bacterium]
MGKILHILNGDSTKQIFSQSTLQGDVIVWREMLCEGDIDRNVGSDAFWKKRYSFFEKEIGITKLDYFDKTIREITKLEDLSNYDQIILWFEFDLFCQINLIALCSYLLKNYRKDIQYFLVCTGQEKGTKHLHSLSDYSPHEYELLYENRIKLSRHDLLFAEESWHKYVENNYDELQQFNFNRSAKFRYLQKAIDQHLERFPDENGLNQIQHKLLEHIAAGNAEKSDIVKGVLHWQKKETVYGFGDLQYAIYLDKLKDYYNIDQNQYKLNKKGKLIVENL